MNFPCRYVAPDSLRAWFQRMWSKNRADPMLFQVRDDLAVLVSGADPDIRDAVIAGILDSETFWSSEEF